MTLAKHARQTHQCDIYIYIYAPWAQTCFGSTPTQLAQDRFGPTLGKQHLLNLLHYCVLGSLTVELLRYKNICKLRALIPAPVQSPPSLWPEAAVFL